VLVSHAFRLQCWRLLQLCLHGSKWNEHGFSFGFYLLRVISRYVHVIRGLLKWIVLVVLRFELSALHLLGKHSTTGATPSALLVLGYFSDRVLHFLLGSVWDHNSATCASSIAGTNRCVPLHLAYLFRSGSHQLFALAGLELQSSWSLPPEELEYRHELLAQLKMDIEGNFHPPIQML
jgi:hypothetical protein